MLLFIGLILMSCMDNAEALTAAVLQVSLSPLLGPNVFADCVCYQASSLGVLRVCLQI